MLLGPKTFKTADDNLFFPMASNSGTRGDKPVIKSFQSFWQLAVQLAQESVVSVQVLVLLLCQIDARFLFQAMDSCLSKQVASRLQIYVLK